MPTAAITKQQWEQLWCSIMRSAFEHGKLGLSLRQTDMCRSETIMNYLACHEGLNLHNNKTRLWTI